MGDMTKFTKTTTQPNGNTSQSSQPSTFDAQGMQPMQHPMMGINPSAMGITPTGYPHFDPLTWAMASNTMKGPFMQFLPGSPVMPRGGGTYGSPIASVPTDSGGNSMKSARRENDTEVSSKSKRHKENNSKKVGKGGNGDGRGVPNKKWGEEKDDFLIPFLANQARMGKKVDKGFRKEAFNAAATALNEKFNESFSGEHVYNHYRNLKTRYQDMLKCFEISGAGWDEETNTITVSKTTYDSLTPKLKEYVNKPLRHFDDLALIVGDDFASGDFKKSVYTKFGGQSGEPIDIDSESHKVTQANNNSSRLEEKMKTSIRNGTTSDNVSSSRTSKRKGSRNENGPEYFNKLIDKVGDVAYSIQNAHLIHWTEKLSKCLYALDGFSNHVLDHALETLYKNEDEARFFIAKPLRSQIFSIEKHIHDYGLAVHSEDVEDLTTDANVSRATINLDEF